MSSSNFHHIQAAGGGNHAGETRIIPFRSQSTIGGAQSRNTNTRPRTEPPVGTPAPGQALSGKKKKLTTENMGIVSRPRVSPMPLTRFYPQPSNSFPTVGEVTRPGGIEDTYDPFLDSSASEGEDDSDAEYNDEGVREGNHFYQGEQYAQNPRASGNRPQMKKNYYRDINSQGGPILLDNVWNSNRVTVNGARLQQAHHDNRYQDHNATPPPRRSTTSTRTTSGRNTGGRNTGGRNTGGRARNIVNDGQAGLGNTNFDSFEN